MPERAAFIAAQLLGVALCRYILRFEPLASLPADDVVAAVGPSVHQYLTGPAGAEPQAGTASDARPATASGVGARYIAAVPEGGSLPPG